MTVPSQPPAVLQPTKNNGALGVNLSLHPLPILTISEHLTRSRVQGASANDDDSNVRVFGALLGTQSGRDVEIHNSFEIKVLHASSAPRIGGAASDQAQAGPSSGPLIDHAFFKSRQAQFKQVFPTFEFVGWYSNGLEPTELDIEIHKQLLEYNEAPLFVQLSPTNAAMASSSGRGELPLQVYESQLEIKGDATDAQDNSTTTSNIAPQLHFVPSSYRIQTGEAERIAVEYASKPSGSTSGTDASGTIAALQTQQSAIRMLADRIQTCHDYVASVRSGAQPPDHETLRRIKALLAGMPAMDTADFKREFLKEYNDVLLTDYLASMTQSLDRLNELVDKFDVSRKSEGPGDRIPGLDRVVGAGAGGSTGGGGGGGGSQRGTKGPRRGMGMA